VGEVKLEPEGARPAADGGTGWSAAAAGAASNGDFAVSPDEPENAIAGVMNELADAVVDDPVGLAPAELVEDPDVLGDAGAPAPPDDRGEKGWPA
jgi:hypothetical protein